MDYICEAEFTKGKYNVKIMRPVGSEGISDSSIQDRIIEIKTVLEQFRSSGDTVPPETD